MKKGKILLPVEFSDNDSNCLRYAAALADDLKWTITLFHIYHPQESARKIHLSDNNYDKSIITYMRSFAADALGEIPASMKFIANAGMASDKIIEASNSFNLILLSSRHYRHIMGRWLSSRTSHVATMAYCPVLIVPITSAKYTPFHHVWAVGHQEEEEALAQKCLTSLGWNEVEFEWREFPVHWLEKTFWTRLLMKSLLQKKSDDLASAIRIRLEEEAIDLIVIVNQNRDNLQKLMNDESKQTAFKFNIPILAVPAVEK